MEREFEGAQKALMWLYELFTPSLADGQAMFPVSADSLLHPGGQEVGSKHVTETLTSQL